LLSAVPGGYRLDLPGAIVVSYARTWAATKRDFVLDEEVEAWLVNNEIPATLSHTGGHYESDLIEYALTFERYDQAFAFLLRWV
jgi:hypothetical protein